MLVTQSSKFTQTPTELPTPITENQKLRIFISYGRESITNAFAEKLHTDLIAKHYEPTLDVVDFIPGISLSKVISSKIADCDFMIVILSDKYSESEWCRDELIFAKETKKKVILIKRGKCNISSQVQFLIGDRLYLSFINDEDYDDNFCKVIRALEEVNTQLI